MQYVRFLAARLFTRTIYRLRLRALGNGSIVLSPLFWTPEFISVASKVLIWPGCRIEAIEPYATGAGAEPHIEIGDGVTIQQNCHITAGGILNIGAGTTILSDVVITDLEHQYEEFGMRVVDQPVRIFPTSVGKNCFIGSGAKVLAGTLLGEHCVVGANTVVRGHFPSGSVIAGIPGRIVKRYDVESRRWVRT
jgi:acetyltransferase-like isoleucine patch superfamily enzyme